MPRAAGSGGTGPRHPGMDAGRAASKVPEPAGIFRPGGPGAPFRRPAPLRGGGLATAPGRHVGGRPAPQGRRRGCPPLLRDTPHCCQPEHYNGSVPDEGFRRSHQEDEHYHLLIARRLLGIDRHLDPLPRSGVTAGVQATRRPSPQRPPRRRRRNARAAAGPHSCRRASPDRLPSDYVRHPGNSDLRPCLPFSCRRRWRHDGGACQERRPGIAASRTGPCT